MTDDNKIVENIPSRAGAGRPKGSLNNTTAAIKEAIEGAFNEVGGQTYLVKIAHEDPKTFCGLLGKVLPAQINLAGQLAFSHEDALNELE